MIRCRSLAERRFTAAEILWVPLAGVGPVLDKILWTRDATAAHCPEEAAFGCVSRLGARVGI
jgi:hypothetical protein